jgi:hypothetical protein
LHKHCGEGSGSTKNICLQKPLGRCMCVCVPLQISSINFN